MKTQKIEIKNLEQWQIGKASEVLENAFNQDPIFSYIAPKNTSEKANFIKHCCQILLCYSQDYHHIYTTTDNIKGVAAWIPPGHSTDNIFRFLQLGIISLLFKMDIRKLGILLSMILAEKYHKHSMKKPHWYLMMLGVSPDFQGQGIGGMLLEPVLQQADREGFPCYLETSTEDAVRFYQRHGFEVIWNGEISKDSLQYWTMKREAKSNKNES
jgi:ribosomal protein S18 acetylase RimI-like enzyme